MNTAFLLLLRSLLLPTLLALLALYAGALTRGGLILAWVLAVLIRFCGGLAGFAVLAAVFLFTVLAGKLSGAVGAEIGKQLHAKSGQRDGVQIICNVLTGAVMLLLRALTHKDCFTWGFAGAMAASLADSMASELGVLSARKPRDICTLRPVEPGISGGVTLLGLACSLLGAALIAVPASFGFGARGAMIADVTAAGFFAALCDSILGSRLQIKYRCSVCGRLVEKAAHCGAPTVPVQGVPRITNDTVNFLNNLLGALAAIALYCLHHKA